MHKNVSKSRPQSFCGCDWLEVSLSREWLEIVEKTPWFENLMARGSSAWAKEGQRWNINGNSLVYIQPQPKQNKFGRITATGQLGNEFLEVLSALVSRDDDGIVVRRLDIKTEIEIPTKKGIKNWENIRKRQEAEESKKMQFARNVQLIISNGGSTLAIGTRGRSKTYCRLEVRTTSVSLELEYRHEKASKIGKTLLKSENPSSQMNFLLKEYLQSLVPIQKITRPLLTKLSVNTGAPCRLPREKVDVKGEASKKKEYCETVIFPFLRKMLENPQMKDWIIVKISALLRSKN